MLLTAKLAHSQVLWGNRGCDRERERAWDPGTLCTSRNIRHSLSPVKFVKVPEDGPDLCRKMIAFVEVTMCEERAGHLL